MPSYISKEITPPCSCCFNFFNDKELNFKCNKKETVHLAEYKTHILRRKKTHEVMSKVLTVAGGIGVTTSGVLRATRLFSSSNPHLLLAAAIISAIVGATGILIKYLSDRHDYYLDDPKYHMEMLIREKVFPAFFGSSSSECPINHLNERDKGLIKKFIEDSVVPADNEGETKKKSIDIISIMDHMIQSREGEYLEETLIVYINIHEKLGLDDSLLDYFIDKSLALNPDKVFTVLKCFAGKEDFNDRNKNILNKLSNYYQKEKLKGLFVSLKEEFQFSSLENLMEHLGLKLVKTNKSEEHNLELFRNPAWITRDKFKEQLNDIFRDLVHDVDVESSNFEEIITLALDMNKYLFKVDPEILSDFFKEQGISDLLEEAEPEPELAGEGGALKANYEVDEKSSIELEEEKIESPPKETPLQECIRVLSRNQNILSEQQKNSVRLLIRALAKKFDNEAFLKYIMIHRKGNFSEKSLNFAIEQFLDMDPKYFKCLLGSYNRGNPDINRVVRKVQILLINRKKREALDDFIEARLQNLTFKTRIKEMADLIGEKQAEEAVNASNQFSASQVQFSNALRFIYEIKNMSKDFLDEETSKEIIFSFAEELLEATAYTEDKLIRDLLMYAQEQFPGVIDGLIRQKIGKLAPEKSPKRDFTKKVLESPDSVKQEPLVSGVVKEPSLAEEAEKKLDSAIGFFSRLAE